jgi:integrase
MELIRMKQRGIVLFEQAAAHYLGLYEKKKSIVSEVYHLQAVMPFIGKLPIDQVHNGTLASFKAARKAEGRKIKTINLSLGVVRRILNLCARDWRDDNGVTWLAQAPLITLAPTTDSRPPKPILWEQQRKLLPCLPDHLAEMALFDLNTGARDDVVCNLQWDWEVPIPQLGVSIFIVPVGHVKGEDGKKTDMVLVCNQVAQSVIDRQRGKHAQYVFVYRKTRSKAPEHYQTPAPPYKPIQAMNNTAWQAARAKAGLGDLHVHDLRHTVGLRLREAGIADRTIDDILWHKNNSMTAHYSMAQIVEVFEALEKIKDETNRWNISLQSIVLQAKPTVNLPQQKKTA